VEESSRFGEATDDNIVHVHFMVGIKILYTDTHSKYIIRIAFPLQQCLHERTSLLTLYVYCSVSILLRNAMQEFTEFSHWTPSSPCFHILFIL